MKGTGSHFQYDIKTKTFLRRHFALIWLFPAKELAEVSIFEGLMVFKLMKALDDLQRQDIHQCFCPNYYRLLY
jgi:hypothetical protein